MNRVDFYFCFLLPKTLKFRRSNYLPGTSYRYTSSLNHTRATQMSRNSVLDPRARTYVSEKTWRVFRSSDGCRNERAFSTARIISMGYTAAVVDYIYLVCTFRRCAASPTMLKTCARVSNLRPTRVVSRAPQPASNNDVSHCAPLRYCLLYTSPSPRDKRQSRMPSSA